MSNLVKKAILRSRLTGATSHVDTVDLAWAGLTSASVCDELFAECDGEVTDGYLHEFWGRGVTEDGDPGDTWRVHVELDT